jgi:hypothetical protein
MRRGAVGAIAGIFLLLAAGSAISAPSRTASVKVGWRATVARLPANANLGVHGTVDLAAISCASPGNCSAVGTYVAGSCTSRCTGEGLLLTEKGGVWGKGVEAVLPADANAPGNDPDVHLTSVSCPSAGNCTAVGWYYNNGYAGLLLTEKNGHWARGVEADGTGYLNSVSCASAGNCTAGGESGVLLTETAGQWGPPVVPPVSSDGDYNYITSVSCGSAGSCSAVGSTVIVEGRDSYAGYGFLLEKEAGTWQQVPVVTPPDGPGEGAYLTAVSCASAGNCSAVGQYNVSIDSDLLPEGLLLTEKAGKWLQGVTAQPPVKNSYWRDVDLTDVSCASKSDCVAVGDSNGPYATMLTEKAGKWQRGVEAALPSGGHASYANAVSCASPGNCTIVGTYGPTDGFENGLLVTEIAGHWLRGIKAKLEATPVSVSCAASGRCGAVGSDPYGDGILLDSYTTP